MKSRHSNKSGKSALMSYPKLNKVDHVDISADDISRADGGENTERQHSSRRTARGPAFTITREEVEEAFKYFDVFGQKRLSPKDLKMRLSVFYPNLSSREYRFLLGNENNFTVDSLMRIIESNTLQNFDPVQEAFKVFDPQGTGYVDEQILKRILRQTGHGEIDDEDMKVLLDVTDVDGDGKISIEDFVNMLQPIEQRQQRQQSHQPQQDIDEQNSLQS